QHSVSPAPQSVQLSPDKTHHPERRLVFARSSDGQTDSRACSASKQTNRLREISFLNLHWRLVVLGDGQNPVTDLDLFFGCGRRIRDDAFHHYVLPIEAQHET